MTNLKKKFLSKFSDSPSKFKKTLVLKVFRIFFFFQKQKRQTVMKNRKLFDCSDMEVIFGRAVSALV